MDLRPCRGGDARQLLIVMHPQVSNKGREGETARCRREHRRYERKPEQLRTFVGIASTLISYRLYTN